MTRFLHTSDWQLGMTRHFLGADAQPRFTQARFDAIVRIGELATEHAAAFVVVAGDVFETNQVSPGTVGRAFEALRAVPVPVFLLPGNHDCLDPASVFRRPDFLQRKPAHVHVLDDATPRPVSPGVEVVGAPWFSKRPLADLSADAVAGLEPTGGTRVLVAHGQVDALAPDRTAPGLIEQSALEQALADRRLTYVALGDRHSTTAIGESGRFWFSGAPEPTAYTEVDAGNVLLVDDGPDACAATPLATGRWRFVRQELDLVDDDALDELVEQLIGRPDKARTVLKLVLTGTLTVRGTARLDRLIDEQRELFAALEFPERHRRIAVRPDDADFGALGLSGYAQAAVDELQHRLLADDEAARDALSLLWRLAGGGQ